MCGTVPMYGLQPLVPASASDDVRAVLQVLKEAATGERWSDPDWEPPAAAFGEERVMTVPMVGLSIERGRLDDSVAPPVWETRSDGTLLRVVADAHTRVGHKYVALVVSSIPERLSERLAYAFLNAETPPGACADVEAAQNNAALRMARRDQYIKAFTPVIAEADG